MNRLHKHKFLKQNPLLVLFAACLLWVSCGGQRVYHAHASLPAAGWNKADTLTLSALIEDSLTNYNLTIGVRHGNDYPYTSLALLLTVLSPDSTCLSTDTLHQSLATEQGVWKNQGIGGCYQTIFPVRTLPVRTPGLYTFHFSHLLPGSILHGISDFSLRLER